MERGGLGFGQRLVLFGAWAVSAGFVFVLGVYVGKGMHGVRSEVPRIALPVEVAEPVPPPADAQAPLTFYDVLGARDGSGTPPAAAPNAATAPAPPPTAPAGLAERPLAAASSAAPRPSDTAAAAPAPPPERPASSTPAAPAPVAANASAAPAAPAAPPASPTPAVAPVSAPPAPPAVAAAPAPPPPVAATGRWTVYANPSRDRLAVEHERAALRAKGFPAEVVTLRRDGDVWYRIRIGRYATEAQAEETSRRLRAGGAAHAFVQSE